MKCSLRAPPRSPMVGPRRGRGAAVWARGCAVAVAGAQAEPLPAHCRRTHGTWAGPGRDPGPARGIPPNRKNRKGPNKPARPRGFPPGTHPAGTRRPLYICMCKRERRREPTRAHRLPARKLGFPGWKTCLRVRSIPGSRRLGVIFSTSDTGISPAGTARCFFTFGTV